jgi:hypothetical protein
VWRSLTCGTPADLAKLTCGGGSSGLGGPVALRQRLSQSELFDKRTGFTHGCPITAARIRSLASLGREVQPFSTRACTRRSGVRIDGQTSWLCGWNNAAGHKHSRENHRTHLTHRPARLGSSLLIGAAARRSGFACGPRPCSRPAPALAELHLPQVAAVFEVQRRQAGGAKPQLLCRSRPGKQRFAPGALSADSQPSRHSTQDTPDGQAAGAP